VVRRSPIGITAKLVLVPIGDGSYEHLGAPLPLPGPLELKEGLLELGREGTSELCRWPDLGVYSLG
jgi:hypothetical protein